MMVLLDGEYVQAEEIDSKKHKYIGIFRPPSPPSCRGVLVCTCGQSLWFYEAIFEHYKRGCFDIAQYVTLNKVG